MLGQTKGQNPFQLSKYFYCYLYSVVTSLNIFLTLLLHYFFLRSTVQVSTKSGAPKKPIYLFYIIIIMLIFSTYVWIICKKYYLTVYLYIAIYMYYLLHTLIILFICIIIIAFIIFLCTDRTKLQCSVSSSLHPMIYLFIILSESVQQLIYKWARNEKTAGVGMVLIFFVNAPVLLYYKLPIYKLIISINQYTNRIIHYLLIINFCFILLLFNLYNYKMLLIQQ